MTPGTVPSSGAGGEQRGARGWRREADQNSNGGHEGRRHDEKFLHRSANRGTTV